MFNLNHKWHLGHRKCLFQNINGIRNLENCYLKSINEIPEHRKCLFQTINGIQTIENVYLKNINGIQIIENVDLKQ